jgi:hypothetical protein
MRTKNLKMMAKLAKSSLLAVLMLAAVSCESDAADQDNGGVILSFADFDGLPAGVRVNSPSGVTCSRSSTAGCVLSIGEVNVRSIIANADAASSDLMTVEIEGYEVRFNRRAPGTRTPPVFFQNVFGSVAPGGTIDFENIPIMGPQQFLTAPLSELLFSEGARDTETGSTIIVLDAQLRFFGRTVSGNSVVTETPAQFTLTVSP